MRLRLYIIFKNVEDIIPKISQPHQQVRQSFLARKTIRAMCAASIVEEIPANEAMNLVVNTIVFLVAEEAKTRNRIDPCMLP